MNEKKGIKGKKVEEAQARGTECVQDFVECGQAKEKRRKKKVKEEKFFLGKKSLSS